MSNSRGDGSLFKRNAKHRACGGKGCDGCAGTGRVELPVWWISYYRNGKRFRETTKKTNEKEAKKILRERLGEIATGTFTGLQVERTRFEDLKEILITNYRINRPRSLRFAEDAFKPLTAFFTGWKAKDIDYSAMERYIASRRDEGRAPATIRNELAILRHAFRLAERSGKVRPPIFPTISVSNARKGFFERPDFEKVRANLPDALRPLVTFLYLTGWRLREVLPLAWDYVDREARIIHLEVGTTKNDDGRTIPYDMMPELEGVIEEQWKRAQAVFEKSGAMPRPGLLPWGRPGDQGLPQRVPRSVAMRITGHKTETIYRRYAITNEQDVREGMQKLARQHAADRARNRRKDRA